MRLTEDNPIQVCIYEGKYPNHTELDCFMVKTKQEAYECIERDKKRCLEKWNARYNYRIVDYLRRFKCIFIEI